MKFRSAATAIVLVVCTLLSGFSVNAADERIAVWPTAGWQVSTPEEQGMDSRALADLVNQVGGTKQDSLLIVRHGKIVVDAYYAPYIPGIRHDLRSVTKSFVGTLTGILLQQGRLESTDRPVIELFEGYSLANVDELKRSITVQNVLDMASGIEWVERTYGPEETVSRMYKSPNPVEFVLSQPMAEKPGAKFVYKGGDSYMLSALVNRLTGQNALEYAKKELFAPLGITDVRWAPIDKQGVVTGEAGLFVTPHDMAKLGYLYLNDGVWNGRRIIPSSFVARGRGGNVATNFGKYANQWWSFSGKAEGYAALGRHGQAIVVLPKLDVVAVLTGSVPDGEARYQLDALVERILDAVKSDQPLSPNAEAAAALDASLLKAMTEVPAAVRAAPALAQALSGKTWRFDDNVLFLKTLKLNLTEPEGLLEFTTNSPASGGRNTLVTEPIGLDGRWRGKQQTFAFVNNRGVWLDDETFQLERRWLGFGQLFYWRLKLDGDKLKLHFRSTDNWTVELTGEPVN